MGPHDPPPLTVVQREYKRLLDMWPQQARLSPPAYGEYATWRREGFDPLTERRDYDVLVNHADFLERTRQYGRPRTALTIMRHLRERWYAAHPKTQAAQPAPRGRPMGR